jgi:NAD(P)-dependent dehydrogenase (short-subunit alcohol dehydrogenase family)
LAQMVADKDIRVNAVAPGPIWTPLIPSTMAPEKRSSIVDLLHACIGPALGTTRNGQAQKLVPYFGVLENRFYSTCQLIFSWQNPCPQCTETSTNV